VSQVTFVSFQPSGASPRSEKHTARQVYARRLHASRYASGERGPQRDICHARSRTNFESAISTRDDGQGFSTRAAVGPRCRFDGRRSASQARPPR
jgi:hypothetical protein